jgi:hypothetical protein
MGNREQTFCLHSFGAFTINFTIKCFVNGYLLCVGTRLQRFRIYHDRKLKLTHDEISL